MRGRATHAATGRPRDSDTPRAQQQEQGHVIPRRGHMIDLEVIPQWVIPLVRVKNADHARIKDGLVAHSYEREKRSAAAIASGVAPKFKSNLYESTFDLFKADVPEVQALARFCSDAVGTTVTELRRRLGRTEPRGLRIEMPES